MLLFKNKAVVCVCDGEKLEVVSVKDRPAV